MCGIAGIVEQGIGLGPDNRLPRMVTSLRHRGPDDCGSKIFPNAALGHTRLSIVDLSSGHQPLESACRQLAVTFNGEIYGYKSLRNHVSYSYQTQSDTEVLLALYSEYGTEMLSRLPGMFAFAIWDEKNQRLFAARDRFGEKPFYYYETSRALYFASEIKGILASNAITPSLDQASVAHYLNRLYVPVGCSIYKEIKQLPPAHAFVYENGTLRIWRYWNLPPTRSSISLADAADEFVALFKQAIERQLVADVEVGAFLSGGLDSSTVVNVASQIDPEIKTFAFGFVHGPNELGFARDVAQQLKVNHTELTDDETGLADLTEQMVDVYDEPFADSSAIPTYMICRKAREHLKVVLTGDGGDELLGGYPWYGEILFHDQLEQQTWLRNLFVFNTMRVRRRLFGGDRKLHQCLKAFQAFYSGNTAQFTHRRLRSFVSQVDLSDAGWRFEPSEYGSGSDGLDSAMRFDIQDYMTGDILVKTDRASMAHGLELRAPFLDVDLASFCIALPSSLKASGRSSKILLREAFSKSWPDSLRSREKQGFGAPVSEWFRRSEFVRLKQKYLLDSRLKIRDLFSDHLVSRVAEENSDGTWAFMILSIWLEKKGVAV
jgi:asparagine synthase (glutamine-hydrolysing)